MEEKERFELFGEHCIKDNNPDARPQLLDTYKAYVLLNEQDKHIKELELLLKADNKIKTNSLNGFEKLRHENQQLKEDCAIYKSSINELYKAQKQLAIDELEFVLKNFINRPAYFDVASQEWCLSDQDKQFIDFINNRIKKLGGGENE